MKYIIENNQVVGFLTIPESSAPLNLKVVDGVSSPRIDLVYYDQSDNTVKMLPEKPGEMYFWNQETNEWGEILVPSTTDIVRPDFDGFVAELSGTPIWTKLKIAGVKSLKLNLAVTVLMTNLTAIKKPASLQGAFNELQQALSESTSAESFTEEELQFIQTKLDTFNIAVQVI